MNKHLYRQKPFRFPLYFLIILVMGCAKQAFPPGGPVDRTPPMIVRTQPGADTTHVAQDVQVEIEFSEPVQQRSVEETLFITPFSRYSVSWKGRRMTIEFTEPLYADRTYVITVGAGAQDRRNNIMEESFTLAFSTGEILDVGRIEGRVWVQEPARPEAVQIWAYDLAEISQPNPKIHEPLYITQAGKDGTFALLYMAWGTYRVFAVLDRDGSGTYDVESDELGVAPGDIAVDSLVANPPLVFRVSRRDTTAPVLTSARPTDRHHIAIAFSEPMQSVPLLNKENISLRGPASLRDILDAYPDPRNAAYAHLTTEALQDTSFELYFKQGFDRNGLALADTGKSIVFQGTSKIDTTSPRYLFMQPSDSSDNVPLMDSIKIVFSESMDSSTIRETFSLVDTSGNPVNGTVHWPYLAKMVFVPKDTLEPFMKYTLSLNVDKVTDLFGNTLADTLFEKWFYTVDPDTLTEILGTLSDADSGAGGPYVMTATNRKNGQSTIVLPSPEAYRFKNLMPGEYVISLFHDADRDGEYSKGQAFPFVPSERYYVYPDTIKTRSSWPNEGNDIEMPVYK